MIGAIVLAAGSSTRMGRQKLLLPYDGQSLIRHVVESVLSGPVAETVVITGHSRNEVEDALEGLNVRFAHNIEYESGMLSSIRTGIRALASELAPMVVLGDQPTVPLTVISALAACIEEKPDCIAVPVVTGRRAHPMAFGACYRDDVLTKFDNVGLRGLLQAYPENVVEIDVASPGILIDLDTPEDYAAALADLRERSRDTRT